MRYLTFQLLLCFSLLVVSQGAVAAVPDMGKESSPGGELTPEDESSPGNEPAPGDDSATDEESADEAGALPDRVDALGRPFPDPQILRRARQWTIGGAALTVGGVSTMVSGLLLGSAVLRGQIEVPFEARYVFGGMLAGGPLLVAVGLPMLSAGNFTRGQLTRKIKGAPKVPRTVANEWAYWRAYRRVLYGQAAVIAGGAGIMTGVLGLVAAGFAAQSEFYTPAIWALPASSFSTGAGFIVLGLLLQKSSRAKMERIRDEVDPFRQSSEDLAAQSSASVLRVANSLALLPLPGFSAAEDGQGGSVPRVSLSWLMRF